MIEAKDISKNYGKQKILEALSFSFPTNGGVFQIEGSNGSGKTTLFNILTGWQKPNYGKINFLGTDISKAAPHKRALLGLSYMPQNCRLLFGKTGFENIEMAKSFLGSRYDPSSNEIVEQLNLTKLLQKNIEFLSKGELRKLEFCISFMQNAKCYILDEPLTGWDADARKIAKDFLLETSQKNRSIILCEHQPDIQNIVTKKYKLENGLMNET